jgi:hypothetical protein
MLLLMQGSTAVTAVNVGAGFLYLNTLWRVRIRAGRRCCDVRLHLLDEAGAAR